MCVRVVCVYVWCVPLFAGPPVLSLDLYCEYVIITDSIGFCVLMATQTRQVCLGTNQAGVPGNSHKATMSS